MRESVHVIYCCYIDEKLSGRETNKRRVRYELKYKK